MLRLSTYRRVVHEMRALGLLGLGYILIILSALFFAVASYAILFSAFLPTPTNVVCIMSHLTQPIFIHIF
jgi:hypothetical protein